MPNMTLVRVVIKVSECDVTPASDYMPYHEAIDFLKYVRDNRPDARLDMFDLQYLTGRLASWVI